MNKYLFWALLVCLPVSADVLELTNGKTFNGTLVGRSGDSIQFESDGISMTFKSSDVKNISVGAGAAPQSAPAAAAPTAAPAPAPAPVAAPAPQERPPALAGTRIMVKLSQALDTRQSGKGHQFTAVLESAIVANGVTLASSGTQVYGVISDSNSAGRLAGKSQLTFSLTGIKINDQIKTIRTSGIKAVGESGAKNTAGKTLGGALIGGLIKGSDGAKTGAKVGVGASVLTKGGQVVIPSGTLLEFTLIENAYL